MIKHALLLALLCTHALAASSVRIVVDAPLAPQGELALAELERVLKTKGCESARSGTAPNDGQSAIIVGIAGSSALADRTLVEQHLELPQAAESLCLHRLKKGGATSLLVSGRDVRGLVYALLEAARAIELAPKTDDVLAAVPEALESPFLQTRSITMHLVNHDLEAAWYFDEAFWQSYLALLARSRFNNFTLTFADQTNYLCPPYAYLVAVPGFPQVRVEGLDAKERQRNLNMLKRIAELAQSHGLEFTLGVWTQMPVEKFVGASRVTNLPGAEDAARFCAAGLREVLRACPAISGVQLRMNAEAGVAEDQQAAFYRPIFSAIHDAGRPVRLDIRFKGLRDETIRDAVASGADVTVSTKFWAEHFGLPYHPVSVDSHYSTDRYSFGRMLAQPRDYRVVYRLWTVGSQRLSLWGDPDYAARFAQSCRLGGGEGFEVFAPLSDKGFGDAPGQWSIFADRSMQHTRWEMDRYWFFHLSFGRLGYNPACAPETWRRELRHRFGESADAVEAAYRSGSQILPLLTAARLPSASEWSWWPEMDTGGRLPEYMHSPTGDPAQFYAIRTWERTAHWRCEEWDSDVPGYVEDALAGKLRAKCTPVQISQKLRTLAQDTLDALDRASSPSPEFRATSIDLRMLAALAQYHAAKTLATTDLAFFELTDEAKRLPRALSQMKEAATAWQRIVQITDGVYHNNLVFGYAPEHARREGHHHTGHWKNRLAEVQEDVATLEKLVEQHRADGKPTQVHPGEQPPPNVPQVTHTPITSARAGTALKVSATIASTTKLRGVVLHHRSLNQTLNWQELPMTSEGDGKFAATIPGKALTGHFDHQYYIEALTDGGGLMWPSWEKTEPYLVVKVR